MQYNYYRNLPLLPSEGYIDTYLDKAYDVIHRAIQPVNKVLAIRLDLHFPRSFNHPEGETISNEYIQRFFKKLRQELDLTREEASAQNRRTHPHYLEYLWAREYDQEGNKPHYHLVLFLNRAAYQSLGHINSNQDNLMAKIMRAWEWALRLGAGQARGTIFVPDNAYYTLVRDTYEGVPELFLRTSYLCKIRSKRPEDGYHGFGGSRLEHRQLIS